MDFHKFHYLFLAFYCAAQICGQIIDGQQQEATELSEKGLERSKKNENAMMSAVEKLTATVSTLSQRVQTMEENMFLRFQVFGEAIAREKSSLEEISSRLDVLDFLSQKLKKLESRVEGETALIRNTLALTNKDVHRVSTQLEDLEKVRVVRGETRYNPQRKKETGNSRRGSSGSPNYGPMMTSSDGSGNSTVVDKDGNDVGSLIIDRLEKMVPPLLAAELNHFYLNMATKTDYMIGQLQTDFVVRLRRIENVAKKSLSEIQDGRQDVSHVSHLLRSLSEKVPKPSNLHTSKCSDCSGSNELRSLLRSMEENIVTKLSNAFRNYSFTSYGREHRLHKEKGGAPQTSLASDVWRGIFPSAITHPPAPHILANSPITAKHCCDSTAYATLEEVKLLLRSLMSKGDDLRRTLTKQASEGVDLLKHLHQRFSILLRRMNTDPGHAEALLAEVQELEHLVENSYSSILLAQNVFIESCRRIQQEQPSIEGQIFEILNKLVTNIDLGHQFNRKQLQEVRQLIEEMNNENGSKNISLIPTLMSNNDSSYLTKSYSNWPSLIKHEVYQGLVSTVSEANITEEKLHLVSDRISEVENELQSLEWSSGNIKDVVDELLTGAKDLKGYSKSQIRLLQSFQSGVLKFVNKITVTNASFSRLIQEGLESLKEQDTVQELTDICVSSLYDGENSSTEKTWSKELITPHKTNLISSKFKELLVNISEKIWENVSSFETETMPIKKSDTQTLSSKNYTPENSAVDNNFSNVDSYYYDYNQNDMWIEDDHNWYRINYYDSNGDEFEKVEGRNEVDIKETLSSHELKNDKNKMTIPEQE